MKIISGSSNPSLAKSIASEIGAELLTTKIDNFSDGELKVQVKGEIGKNVMIIQSTNPPVNDHLMELLLLVDTAKRAGAERIIALMPYFGYSRQDRCTYQHGPISASLVIKMIEAAGVTELITLDLHSEQLEGMFNIPITNLSTEKIFLPIINKENSIIVSPDIGGINRARNYSSLLNLDLAIINKSRDNNNCSMSKIIGNIKKKNCIIIDDIIDGGTTLVMATDLLIENGVKNIDAIITHAVFSGNAIEKVEESSIRNLYISDSIRQKKLPKKFTILPISKLIGEAI